MGEGPRRVFVQLPRLGLRPERGKLAAAETGLTLTTASWRVTSLQPIAHKQAAAEQRQRPRRGSQATNSGANGASRASSGASCGCVK